MTTIKKTKQIPQRKIEAVKELTNLLVNKKTILLTSGA